MAEVREMSAHEATEALMARLSYAASMRIRRQKSHHKTAKTALLFCVLVSNLYRINFNINFIFKFLNHNFSGFLPIICTKCRWN